MTDPQNATLEGLDMPAGKTVQFNGTSARGDVPPAGQPSRLADQRTRRRGRV